jgi:hypothetical protein
MRGEEINVGVLGASVTQGHSVPPVCCHSFPLKREGSADLSLAMATKGLPRWEDKFFEDFQKLFPTAKMHVGAVGAMDSRVRLLSFLPSFLVTS